MRETRNTTTVWDPNSYRCHLAIIREDDGSFSAIVLNLPGVGSCGATEDEAISNAREAAIGTIASYLADHVEIPWQDSTAYSVPEGARQKWIMVNA